MKNLYPQISGITEEVPIQSGHFSGSNHLDAANPPRGWIFYDGDCGFCTAAVKRFEGPFTRRGFRFLPFSMPWVQERLGLRPGQTPDEMRVLTSDHQDFGGADAVIYLARQLWWTWPLFLLAQIPGARRVLHRAYRWVAAHRGCRQGACQTWRDVVPLTSGTRRSSSLQHLIAPWIGLIVLPILALSTWNHLAPWIFMWLMAGAIFFGCKWLTFSRAKPQSAHSLRHAFAYFVLWAGLDAARFLGPRRKAGDRPGQSRALAPVLIKMSLGALLVFGVARMAPHDLVAGWIGMIGLVLILHFGLFDLAGIAWHRAGVDAPSIMNAPIKAKSLSEFWGRRWNGAFHRLVLDTLFRPLARRFGPERASLTTFLLSGLLHELVISLPARAGYGWPTFYFLWQGWGVIAQRTPIFRQWGLDRGTGGRLFTILIVAGPAFWLFHPPFVHRVVIPFLQAIHAL